MMKSLLAVVALLLSVAPAIANQGMPDGNDPDGIYRLDPNLESDQWVPVPLAEVKAGLVYNYYNESLQRRAWGIANEQGRFDYAFGQGTTVPITMLDLRITPQMEARVLDQRRPRLLSELLTIGRSAAVRLDASNQWQLLPFPSSARIFDLLTSRRWEWHGPRRVAVVHTGGYLWHVVDGRYLPVTVAMPTYACR